MISDGLGVFIQKCGREDPLIGQHSAFVNTGAGVLTYGRMGIYRVQSLRAFLVESYSQRSTLLLYKIFPTH